MGTGAVGGGIETQWGTGVVGDRDTVGTGAVGGTETQWGRVPSEWRLERNSNLELKTYRNEALSGKSDFHVEILKYPREE